MFLRLGWLAALLVTVPLLAILRPASPPPRRALAPAATYGSPQLVWNGAGYGLLFQADRDGRRDIAFVRLDADGRALGEPVRLTAETGGQAPQLVGAGADYWAGWLSGAGQERAITLVPLDASGRPRGAPVVLAAPRAPSVRLVAAGSRLLVGWIAPSDEGHALMRAAVSADGKVEGPTAVYRSGREAPGTLAMATAPDGLSAMAALEVLSPSRTRLVLHLVEADGRPLAHHELDGGTGGVDPEPVAVAWDTARRRFGMAFGGSSGGLRFAAVGRGGIELRRAWLSDRDATSVAFAWAAELGRAGEYGLAFADEAADLLFARVAGDGTLVGRPLRVPHAGAEPSLAWTGSAYGLVFVDVAGGRSTLRFARIVPRGATHQP